METKEVKVPFLKKEEYKERYYHFGYIITSELDAGSETILTLERDKNYPLMDKVIKLEKQYNAINHKFSIVEIIFFAISIVLIIIGVLLPHPFASLVFIVVGSVILSSTIFYTLCYLIIKLNFKKIQTKIYKRADALLFQNMPDLPIGDNVSSN
jgi:uncharacterized Tic20 family protein